MRKSIDPERNYETIRIHFNENASSLLDCIQSTLFAITIRISLNGILDYSVSVRRMFSFIFARSNYADRLRCDLLNTFYRPLIITQLQRLENKYRAQNYFELITMDYLQYNYQSHFGE